MPESLLGDYCCSPYLLFPRRQSLLSVFANPEMPVTLSLPLPDLPHLPRISLPRLLTCLP
jgi:hypothetical protein